jgi:23S rRNA pseudouridine2605 synthase
MSEAHPGRPVGGERIAKAMARAGLCSRREAEQWILAGRVKVNGVKLASPAKNVLPTDIISVDGKAMQAKEKTRLWRYHKPRGLLTTARDPQGRPTVFENLPKSLPRVVSVGRLDLNSEGLLLLTNDGELARKLELPATGWIRRYRVRVNGQVEVEHLNQMRKGLTVDGIRYGSVHASLDRQQGDNAWLTMSLTEGKNREIRKLCGHFGWAVSRLIRLSYGPFQLGHLEKGEAEEVVGKVVKEQLGLGKKPEEKPLGKPGAPRKSVVKLPPRRSDADRRRKP